MGGIENSYIVLFLDYQSCNTNIGVFQSAVSLLSQRQITFQPGVTMCSEPFLSQAHLTLSFSLFCCTGAAGALV